MQKFLRTLMLVALLLPFASQAQTLTVCDGTVNSQYIPFDGYNADAAQHNQMIYPASELTAMSGQAIMQMVFYIDPSANNGSNTAASRLGTWTVSLGETTATTLSALDNTTTLTQVYQGYFDCSTGTLTIEFDQAYLYNGGNLLVDLNHAAASWNRWYFLGVTTTDDVAYNSNDDDSYSFLPKCTFTYGAAPTCFKVSDLAIDATQTTNSSLTLTWADARNTDATYSIYNGETVVASNVSGTTYTVTGLDANTYYTFGVMTDCGDGDVTDMVYVSGRTACAAIATLPYTMGFEDADLQGTTSALLFPFCWTRINTSTSTSYNYYPYAYNYGTPHDGGRHLYFYAYSYGSYADTTGFVMPELDVTTYPMNGNRVTFWAKASSSSYPFTVRVGTMTDPTDRSTFTLAESVNVAATSYTKYTVSLASATATDAYVAFIVPKVGSTMYIDDVTLEELPSCGDIASVQIASTSTESITLRWTAVAGANGYTIYDMADNSVLGTTTDTTYTVDDLEPNTAYTLGVQSNCSGGDGLIATVSGRTACVAITIDADNLFSESFEGTAFPPDCWSTAHTDIASGRTDVWQRQTSTSDVHTGSASAKLPDMQTGNKANLVTPLFDIDEANAYMISFWMKRVSSTKPNEGVKVWVNTTPDTIGGTPLMHIRRGFAMGEITETEAGWYKYSAAIPTSGEVYIIFEGISEYGNYSSIDDIAIEVAPSCLPVTVVLDSLMGTTAYVSWANTGASSYEVEVRQNDVAVTTASVLIEDDTTAVISDLDIDNDYQIVVRADCGSDYSPWSSPVNVHIGYCLPNPTSVDGSGITGVAFGGMTNTTSHPTSAPFYMNNSTMAGSVPAGTTASVDITFATGYTYGTIIWVDWNNSMSFDANEVVYRGTSLNTNPTTLTAEFDIPATTEEGNYRMRIAAADSYFDSYVSNPANNPNPCFSSTYSWAEDYTLTVTEAPSCTHVTGLTATGITAESVVLRWTGAADAYNVYEITGTDATLVETVNVDTVLIENLTAMTDYTFGVASACGSDESDTVYVSFTTACATAVMPFTQNFNNLTSGIPMCWDNEEGTTTTADYRWNYYATGHDGAGLRFNCYYNSNGNTNVLATPAITIDEAAQLSFWYKNPTGGDFTVMVGIAGSETRTTLATGLTGVSDWTLATYVLPDSLVDEDVVVYFKGTSNYGNGDAYIYLDDVTIEAVPDCMPVSDLAATNVTADSATLTWTGTADSYNVYTIVGDDTNLVDNVTDMFIELDNLTAMTSYTYGVASVCGSDESEMRSVDFTTACAAVTLPYTETFAATSATSNCWTLVSNNTANVGGSDGMGFVTVSGRDVMRFSSYTYASDYNQYGFSPLMNVSTDATNLQVKVVYGTYGTSDQLFFGYITATDTVWDPTPYTTNGGYSASDWQSQTFVIPATATQLAVHYYGNFQYYAWVDSVVVTEMTGDYCYPVSALTVDSATTTSISLSWTSDATSFTVLDMSDSSVIAANVTATSYEVTGLTAMTAYTFGVVVNCATGNSDTMTITANTACADITTLPYYEGFDNADLGCWTTVNGSTDGENWFAFNPSQMSGGVTAHNGAYVASSWSWNSSAMHANAWLISPKFVLPTINTGDSLTFSWWELTASGYPDNYSVAISTTNNDTASFTVVRPRTQAATTWTQQTIDLTAYAGQSIYVAFHHQDYDMNYLFIDDISLYQGAYVPPAPDTLKVTFATADATMGTTDPAPGVYNYIEGDTIFFGSQANNGYIFQKWVIVLGDGAPQELGPQFANGYYIPASNWMSYDSVSFTAYFEPGVPDSVQVTYAVNNATMGTITPAAGTYNVVVGSAVTAQATPNTGYELTAWVLGIYNATGSLINTDTTFATDADFSNPVNYGPIPQSFADNNYTITVTALFDVQSTPQPVTEATIAASDIVYWVGSGNNQMVMAVNWANAAYAWGVRFNGSITVQNALDTIATYDPRFNWTTGSYGLGDITFVEGNINLAGDSNSYWESKNNGVIDAGLGQTLANGDFEKWAQPVAGVVTDSVDYGGVYYPIYTYPMTIIPMWAPQVAPSTLTVTFTTNDANLGTTNPAPGTYTYGASDTVFFNAIPTTGNSFVAWIIDYSDGTADTVGAQYQSGYYFLASSMMGDGITSMTFTAYFQAGVPTPDSVAVTYTVNDSTMGSINPNGVVMTAVGDTVAAVATANAGFELYGWGYVVTYNGSNIRDTIFETTVTAAAFLIVPQLYADYGVTITITAMFRQHEGINDVTADMNIYSTDNKIIVKGAEGEDIYIYDLNGRTVATKANANETMEFTMANSGVYMVKVGNAPAKRVLVIR